MLSESTFTNVFAITKFLAIIKPLKLQPSCIAYYSYKNHSLFKLFKLNLKWLLIQNFKHYDNKDRQKKVINTFLALNK